MREGLQTISEFLSDTPMCFLATAYGDVPGVRPFQF